MPPNKLKVVLGITVAVLAGSVLVLRNPIRHAWKARFHAHAPSTGRFQNCEGLASDSEGNLYVASQDTAHLAMLDRNGKMLLDFDTVEGYHDGDGNPDHITRGNNLVAIAPRHLVLVGRHNVAEIDLAGEKPKLIRIVGTRGSELGQMDGPEGLCRDANGDLYVTDEHNRRINIFDKDGKFLRMFEVPQDPQTVTVWKDRVYVALDKRNYIACYSKEGKELFRIGHAAVFPLLCWIAIPGGIGLFALLLLLKKSKAAWGALAIFALAAAGGSAADYLHHDSPGQFRLPDYILVSRDGTSLYITDRANARIQVTDLDGRFKFMFGSYGKGESQFIDPKDLAWDADGNLVVADSDNNRLEVFTPAGKYLREIR
jgi:sugar lactone lactonase YvrE